MVSKYRKGNKVLDYRGRILKVKHIIGDMVDLDYVTKDVIFAEMLNESEIAPYSVPLLKALLLIQGEREKARINYEKEDRQLANNAKALIKKAKEI